MALEKTYRYEISRNGVFLGILQNVTSKFGFTQNINSAGVQVNISVGQSADVAPQAPSPLLDETGDPLLDETGAIITDEKMIDIVGDSSEKTLIRNDNDISIYEFSDYHPNGVLVFR